MNFPAFRAIWSHGRCGRRGSPPIRNEFVEKPKNSRDSLSSLEFPTGLCHYFERGDVLRKPKLVEKVDGGVVSARVCHQITRAGDGVPHTMPGRVKIHADDLKNMADTGRELVVRLVHVIRHFVPAVKQSKISNFFSVV